MSRRVRLCRVDTSDDGDDEREMPANLALVTLDRTAYYAPTLWLVFSTPGVSQGKKMIRIRGIEPRATAYWTEVLERR